MQGKPPKHSGHDVHTIQSHVFIAAGLTRQEWLLDRQHPHLKICACIPVIHNLFHWYYRLLQSRLMRIACRKTGAEDINKLIKTLISQGNQPRDLFQRVSKYLTKNRIQQEEPYMTWVANALHSDGPLVESILKELYQSTQINLSQSHKIFYDSLEASFTRHARERLECYANRIIDHKKDTRFHAYACLRLAREARDIEYRIHTICKRLSKDLDAIKTFLNIDLLQDPPLDIKLQAGDIHQNGESTSLILLESGNYLAYKPRDMSLEKALLDQLNITAIPSILPREGYGYQNVVSQDQTSELTAKHFGNLLASLDILGAVDLHNENLILDSKQAWLIDGETLLHRFCSNLNNKNAEFPPLGDSILSIGVIEPPFKKSFIGGDFAMLRHSLSLLGSSSRIKNQSPEKNCLAPLSSQEQLLLKAYRDQLNHPLGAGGLDKTALASLKGLKRRIVMRSTRIYSGLINHIDRQTKVAPIERTLDGLWHLFSENREQLALIDLAQAESIEIIQGHIPIFTTNIGSKIIDKNNGIQIPARQHQFVLRNAEKRRLLRGTKENQDLQVDLLQAAIKLIRKPDLNQPIRKTATPDQASHLIQQHLKDTKIRWNDQFLWLSLSTNDSTNQPFYSLNKDVYCGAQGIQLALKMLQGEAIKNATISRTSHHNNKVKNISLSDTTLASLISTLLLLGFEGFDHRKLGTMEKSLKAEIVNTSHILVSCLTNASRKPHRPKISCDLISGLAGLISVLQGIKQNYHNEERNLIISVQRTAALILLQRQKKDGSWPSTNPILDGLTGWSHGTSGIAAALAALVPDSETGFANQLLQAIHQAIGYELRWLTPTGDWIDRRTERLSRQTKVGVGQSWCHGAPGALLAAVVMNRYEISFSSDLERWRELAIKGSLRAKPASDSLCCGTSGLLLIQELAAEEFRSHELQERAKAIRHELAQKTCAQSLRLGDYFPLIYLEPGLFNGLAGIALALKFKGNERHIRKLLSYGLLA